MNFEWNSEKAELNLTRHGVSFPEAATVFGDPLSLTVDDPDHSVEELRFLTMGLSEAGQLLIVSHTDRDGRIRIISARPMTSSERRFYEQGD